MHSHLEGDRGREREREGERGREREREREVQERVQVQVQVHVYVYVHVHVQVQSPVLVPRLWYLYPARKGTNVPFWFLSSVFHCRTSTTNRALHTHKKRRKRGRKGERERGR